MSNMSGKIGRKDFKTLFGADDSDEEDFLVAEKNTTHIQADNVHNNIRADYQEKSENFYRSSNIHNELMSNNEFKQKDIGDRTKKRSNDIKEITRNKKIKSKEENKEFNTTLEKLPDNNEMKEDENGVKQEGISDESDIKRNLEDKKTKSKKMKVGSLVVKLLTPAYVERRFDSKETFKMLARNISHALANKDEQEIREYIKNFLSKNEEFTSQTIL